MKEKALEGVKGEDAVLDERIAQSIRQQGNLEKRNEKLQAQIDQWTAQMETLAKEFDVLEEKKNEAARLVGDLEKQQAERQQSQKDNEAKMKGVVSRKKQVVPGLMDTLNRDQDL